MPDAIRDFILNAFPDRELLDYDTGAQSFTVYDRLLGEFHLMGLAQQYEVLGSVKKTVKWSRGGAPNVTDGWGEKGGR